MKQSLKNFTNWILIAWIISTVIFVEVSSLKMISKVMRAEKNYQYINVM